MFIRSKIKWQGYTTFNEKLLPASNIKQQEVSVNMVIIPNGKTLKKVLAMMSTSFFLWGLASGMVSADGMARVETPIAMNN